MAYEYGTSIKENIIFMVKTLKKFINIKNSQTMYKGIYDREYYSL